MKVFLLCLLSLTAFADDPPSKDGVVSPYSPLIEAVAREWPPENFDEHKQEGEPLRIRCLETPGSPDYVGAEQYMEIQAPFEKVASILDDIDHYSSLFPDFDAIKVVSKEKDYWITFWEQHIPLFFVPNLKYEMIYWIDRSRKDRALYRYRLRSPTKLKLSDGVIGIDSLGPTRTRYIEYDFFEGDWGILKSLAPGRVWKDSIEGLYLSDAAIKIKAEQPEKKDEDIRALAKAWLEKYPVEDLIKKKSVFYKWKSAPK